jgi:peptide/nickel transport system permease protein
VTPAHPGTAVVAITINFFLSRLMPGNPALAVLGKAQSAESPQAIAALEVCSASAASRPRRPVAWRTWKVPR